MNPAKNTVQNQPASVSDKTDSSSKISSQTAGKEAEIVTVTSEKVSEVKSEVDIPAEVAKVGVKKVHETIELAPDVAKLGAAPSGPSQPVVSATAKPSVSLPISDDKVLSGLSAQVTSALAWLSVWCIKKLQKAHLRLRVIHGKIVREKN